MEFLRQLEPAEHGEALLDCTVRAGSPGVPEEFALAQSDGTECGSGRERARHKHEVNERDRKRDEGGDQSSSERHCGPPEALRGRENVELYESRGWLSTKASQSQMQRTDFHSILR
jgi:hypothetical protein